jgi:predicted nucleotidyltransferase
VLNAEESIIKTLAYFNLFAYPLRKDEIFNLLDARYEKGLFEDTLDLLCDAEMIYRIDEFYSLQQNVFLADRRRKGNERAAKKLKTAGKIARILYSFPFVKGVAVSGSLSKHYAEENSDIDFFIVTTENRLWLARTFLHLFKKLSFLAGKQHWLCMNYFIDETALEIKEKNIFTAVEVITLLPFFGNAMFKDFFSANKWAKSFFPVYHPKINAAHEMPKSIVKTIIESVFTNKAGDWLNKRLMQVTVNRWKKKAERHQRSFSGELMGLDGGLHYAKPDPANFQRKILFRLDRETEAIMLRWESVNTTG